MYKLKVISLIACMALSMGIQAQKKSEPSPTVDDCMAHYDFDQAEELLQRQIKVLKRKKQPTIEAEKKLEKIAMARSMILATERVVIIDSVVTDKTDFLQYVKISSESGILKSYADFFGTNDTVGSVYLSELGNKIYYSMPPAQKDKEPKSHIYTSDLLGGEWSRPAILKGLDMNEEQDYPFMMPDGVTLYFGAKGENSLGGYDIFVTRYDADSRTFLKAENIGMPFNSLANDYMYAIDEVNNLGWFVTDRFQPEGKVCIYVFVPNALRKTYDTDAYSEEELRDLARISQISATWGDTQLLAAGRERLAAVMNEREAVVKQKDFDFVVNDELTYTLVAEFKSPEAQKMAGWWKENKLRLKKEKGTLQQLRDAYMQGNQSRKNQLRQQILTMEQACEKLQYSLDEQEVKIRNTEIEYLNRSK